MTPVSERLHIVLLGERNSGKSSLVNAIAGQGVSIVSAQPGTTTDSVRKNVELPGLGACVLIDTAGLDDSGALGEKRVAAARQAAKGADIAVIVVDATTGRLPEKPEGTPVVCVLNKSDLARTDSLAAAAKDKYGVEPVRTCAATGEGIPALIKALAEAAPADNAPLLTEGVANPGDLVVLVMPQDSEAPKGRLILPQQQTLRELLDRGCTAVCCTTAGLKEALDSLAKAPDAIITDSRDFAAVKAISPEGARLTSFSILQAAAKGDLEYFKKGARAIDTLTSGSRVLIAEACAHVPDGEDIGRVKIPALLRARAGKDLRIDFASGPDWPADLRPYDLIIHCGACMFTRGRMLSRVAEARAQGVPMTNYGVTIAYINNII